VSMVNITERSLFTIHMFLITPEQVISEGYAVELYSVET
jgi:hypothetical protein